MENLGVHDIEKYLEEIPNDADVISEYGDDLEDEMFEINHLEPEQVEAIETDFEFGIENMG